MITPQGVGFMLRRASKSAAAPEGGAGGRRRDCRGVGAILGC